MLEPGALVAGKLRIERILGQGGMGTVAAAVHVGLDQRVAIKVLKPELANQPDVVARFVREARAAAKLRSEHVCRVTDVGETADGETYIEMELLDGQDLASLIGIRPLAVEIAADYIVQACVAIAEAHHLGIIHRDLKPANLFVTHRLDGSALIKVLDFGIATAPSAEDFKITKTTTVMGSPGYMSPEHLRSARDVDVRSDIWALGVILYEAVSGRLPFSATSITELAVKVVMDEPHALTDVDPRYAAIVARCLKKPPDERYQSVGELAAALGEIGGQPSQTMALLVGKLLGESPSRSQSAAQSAAQIPAMTPAAAGLAPTIATMPPTAPPAAVAPPAPPPSTTLTSAASATFEVPKKRGKGLMFAVAGLAVLAAAAVAFALVARGESDKPVHAAAHHRDAGAPLVSTAAPADAAPVADPKIREMLTTLAADKDYRAILEAASKDPNDPQIASIVADVKPKFVEQETKHIADRAARGDCAGAKGDADRDAGLVPEATSQLAKAATCVAKGSASTPSTTPTKPTTPTTVATAAQAADAYNKNDYKTALATAQQVLQATPKDQSAIDTATLAACGLGDSSTAQKHFADVAEDKRVSIIKKCRAQNVDVLGAVRPEADSASHAAQDAINKHDWATAKTQARAALKLEPNNHEALHALGVAACRTNDDATLEDVMNRVRQMPRVAAQIRRSCGSRTE